MEYEENSLFNVECISQKGELIKFSKIVTIINNIVFTKHN